MRHRWNIWGGLDGTPLSRAVGGFAACVRCGLMRFSRPGYPPTHYYTTRTYLEVHKDDDSANLNDVMHLAPPCEGPRTTTTGC